MNKSQGVTTLGLCATCYSIGQTYYNIHYHHMPKTCTHDTQNNDIWVNNVASNISQI